MSGRPTREEKRAQTRARLLTAAAEVFGRRGFAAATLDDVAEAAGLTKGAVYSNFAGKDELLFAVIDERLNRRMVAIAEAVDDRGDTAEQAAEAGRLLMQVFGEERELYLLWLECSVYAARHPEFGPRFIARDHEIRSAMATLLAERARAAGLALPMPAEHLAIALFALGDGLALENLKNPGGVPEELFGQMLALLFRGLADGGPG